MKKFHERLQECLTAKKVKQADVVKACGMQTGTVSRYFSGESLPKAMELLRLAGYFGVSMEWLLIGEEARDQRTLTVKEDRIPYEVTGNLTQKSMEQILASLEDFQQTIKKLKEQPLENDESEKKDEHGK